MSDAPTVDPSIALRRRWLRHAGRWLFAVLFVGLPLLGMAALGTLWVRSYRVEDFWTVDHGGGSYDPVARVDCSAQHVVGIAATAGVLSFVADWWTFEEPVTDPDDVRRIVARYEAHRAGLGDPDEGLGWRWEHEAQEGAALEPARVELTPAPPFDPVRPDVWNPPANLLAVPRTDSFGRPLTYLSWIRLDQRFPHDTARVVAPFWAWMLPLAVPILWWLWCPPGRVVPRWTLRRTMIVTLGIALILTILSRSSPVDHAVMTLQDFGAGIRYGPDPAGSGRPVPVIVSFDQAITNHRTMITSTDAARIADALGRLPVLRMLVLDGNPGPPSIETAMLPPGRPDLVSLSLVQSNAGADTLARLAEFPHLRHLVLTRSLRLGDASLAHLRRLPELADLTLGHLRITDAGLEHLRGLPRLRQLDFRPLPNPGYVNNPPNQLTLPALQGLADSLPSLEELTCPDGTVLRPRRPGVGGSGSAGAP